MNADMWGLLQGVNHCIHSRTGRPDQLRGKKTSEVLEFNSLDRLDQNKRVAE